MPYKFNCKLCGAEYSARIKSHVYCSRICRGRGKRARMKLSKDWSNRMREQSRVYRSRLTPERKDNKRKVVKAWLERRKSEGNPYRSPTSRRNRTRRDELKSAPCMDCGQTFPPCCMDFDHVRGEKTRGVGNMITYNTKKFFEEISKCDLVCANCHRIRTQNRRNGKPS